MVEIEQYPDTMVVESAQGEIKIPCRFRPSRGVVFRKRQDGTDVQVAYDIAFPEDTETLLIGTVFNAINERGDVFVFQQELLTFHVGAFHCLGSC